MSLYLLDTNILIDLAGAKRSRPFFDRLLKGPPFQLATHILCAAEYYSGAGGRETKFLEDWMERGSLEVLYLDALQDAVQAGRFRKKYGMMMADALIAATTLRARGHLLTHDTDLLKKSKSFLAVSDPFE